MSRRKKAFDIKEDKTQPTYVFHDIDGSDMLVRESNDTFNRFLLSDRDSHGKRVKVRLAFEVWARARKYTAYKRLRGKHIVLSLPNADQAELAIEAIRNVCKSLDGKWLAK